MADTSDPKPTDDLSALAWVHTELRRTLENANKALRRYLKESESASRADLDTVDPAALRNARTLIHQGVGALELVGLPAAARLLRATEAAVQRMLQRPLLVTDDAVHAIERATFALLDYLARLLAGKEVSPIGMFPQYAAVQALAGADRAHPADLWEADFAWHDLGEEPGLQARPAGEAALGTMEAIVLRLMRRADPHAWTRLSDLCAELAAGAKGRGITLWRLAAAFAEAESAGLLPQGDVHTKRVAARLLAQLRLSAKRPDEPPAERLAQDLLFFCAHAHTSERSTPRLDAVRRAWQLAQRSSMVDYQNERLGRFDPTWIAQARKRVAGAKDVWSAVAGGESHRLPGLTEQMALLGDSVDRLFPGGPQLTRALVETAARVTADGGTPPVPLAMEVATSVLYLDATLEDGELDQPDLESRVLRMAQRITEVRNGAEPQPLEPWMEELYRRVSDRQTMGSVVHELRASLSEVEKQIDQYFRNPSQREVLIPVPAQLSSMRGVLSVLGMDQASQAVVHMRDDVDALSSTEVDPQQAIRTGTFDRLADNLGALSFLIDMLSVQPQLAKSLFRFDPEQGTLSAVMGQAERPSAFADLDTVPSDVPMADQARAVAEGLAREPQGDHAAALEQLSQLALASDRPGVAGAASSAQRALEQATDPAHRQALGAELAQTVGQLLTATPPAPPTPASAPVPAHAVDPGDDPEMREIFLEEAREVIDNARASLQALAEAPEDVGELTTVRRAFHTLKGSSRMVGLKDFGEAAWACEQLYNARLAQSPRLDHDLGAFTHDALEHLGRWVDDIAAGQAQGWQPQPIIAAADSLRLQGRRVAIDMAPPPAPAPQPPADLPLVADMVEDGRAVQPIELPVLDLPALDPAAVPPLDEPELATVRFDAEPRTIRYEHEPTTVRYELEPETPAVDPELATQRIAPLHAAPPVEPEPGLEPPPLDLPPLDLPVPEVAFDLPPADAAFELDLPGAPAASASPVDPLPDVPLAADLDLSAPPQAPQMPADIPAPAFELDLGEGELDALALDLPPVAAPAVQGHDGITVTNFVKPPVADPVPADLPLPDLADVVEIDFGDLQAPPLPEVTEAPLSSMEVTVPLAASDFQLLEQAAEPDLQLPLGGEAPDHAPAPAPAPQALDLGDLNLDLGPLEPSTVEPHAVTGGALQPLLDLGEAIDLPLAEPVFAPAVEPAPEPAVTPEAASEPIGDDDEPVKVIGSLRIPIPLFNIYLNEADELSRRLSTELAEWSVEFERRPVSESTVVLAHSLAGSSATVGFAELSGLARALEHALIRSAALGAGRTEEPPLFSEAAEEIRRLLHQFAAGFLKSMTPGLLDRLTAHERHLAQLATLDDSMLPSHRHGLEDAMAAAAESRPMPLEPVPVADATTHAANDVLTDLVLDDAPAALPAALPVEAPAPVPDPELLDDAAPVAPLLAAVVPGAVGGFAALAALPEEATLAPVARRDAFDDDQDIEAVDSLDTDLFPIFEEEAEELLPQLQTRLRDWALNPLDGGAPSACMRTLHTFKGGARLAGAMRLGEMAHRLETAVEHLAAGEAITAAQVEQLIARADRMAAAYDLLRKPAAAPQPVAPAPQAQPVPVALPVEDAIAPPAAAAAPVAAAPLPSGHTDGEQTQPAPVPAAAPAAAPVAIDWTRFGGRRADVSPAVDRSASSGTAVRVRASLLDRLVNHAGEVSITRARIDSDVHQLQGAVNDLTDNLDRLRSHLRDIELQAESQISSRIEAAKAASQSFDPLEMDRFTRFQELTRMMAESVNDVATVQRAVQRTLQSTEDELAAQARLTRELQDDLLRTRMIEFDSLSDRLYRVVRQAAKDGGKQVRLDIVGGAIEVDRGVLERMVGPFEHLLRNCVAHGIETPDGRQAAGKDSVGSVRVTVTQEGNEIGVDCRDDGAGLDLARIRQRAEERGLLTAGQAASDADLANLIFRPGFSTATEVTELAGRGVGLDVVRSEVNAMGGRIETASTQGQGTSFKLVLPLTTAVTQVVLLRFGGLQVAVPSTLVEVVRRVPTAQVEQAYSQGALTVGDQAVPFFWLGGLLQHSARGQATGRSQAVVVVRSAAQRVALHVDDVVGNQEVVVKNVGPQLARLPGLAGVTLLPSGAVALIYNPVALAALYGQAVQRLAQGAPVEVEPAQPAAASASLAPLVLVVDDSLTVRRVTQRLLAREGYRVALAKDGLDAIEKLAEERPAILLSDIEMPRMDGFDLVRNVRADPRLADLPVVMITSRIAQKHRDYAAELGVDHYLGKPYAEDQLLDLVHRYAGVPTPV